jgi:Na+/H+ antiporter NhaD/arsenite permease-like protein
MGYEPALWAIGPFAILLGMIALGPLLFEKWWLKHYPKVALGLASITLTYYLFFLPAPARSTVAHTALEYMSFIALVGSLFVVSGGIHINVKGEATPHVNVAFLFVGAVISNFLGTTGASMLLIRPWLRMNKYRVTAHHVVFFILIVSNVGGCLTPIGDPPLFLGYLKGVPFWWVAEHCWKAWCVGVGFLLACFYIVDRLNYQKAPKAVRAELAEPPDEWRFRGLPNLGFLAVILGAVFLQSPIREAIMVGAAVGSWFLTRKEIHEANHFNFHPIQEVAVLFIGIFATMMPALDYLQSHASAFAKAGPGFFYWACGTLSAFLDNAPTYLSFLKAIVGAFIDPQAVQQVQTLIANNGADMASATEPVRNAYDAIQRYFGGSLKSGKLEPEQIQIAYLVGNAKLNGLLEAISISSVFFGACTYIGNGPNFMVKAIAEHQKVHVPGFLGYIGRFTIPFMVPMLLLVWLLFFRT